MQVHCVVLQLPQELYVARAAANNGLIGRSFSQRHFATGTPMRIASLRGLQCLPSKQDGMKSQSSQLGMAGTLCGPAAAAEGVRSQGCRQGRAMREASSPEQAAAVVGRMMSQLRPPAASEGVSFIMVRLSAEPQRIAVYAICVNIPEVYDITPRPTV